MKVEELFEATTWQKEQVDIIWDSRVKDILEELLNAVDLIKRDCKPFIKEMKKFSSPLLLYRGVSNSELFISRTTNPKRMTIDSSRFVTAFFNKMAYDNFGAKFRTENVIFGSGSYGQAAGYGNVYAVFPIGDFKFLWSPKIIDFYNSQLYGDIEYNASQEFVGYIKTGKMKSKKMIEIYKEIEHSFLNEYKYSNKNLEEAIKSKHEIMVQAKKFYAINFDKFRREITDMMPNDFNRKSPEYSMFRQLKKFKKKPQELIYYAVTQEPQK